MKTIPLGNEKGSGIIWALLILAMMTSISASVFGLSFWEARNVSADLSQSKAFYLAEAGLDHKLQEIRLGNSNSISPTTLGPGSYQVTYNSATGQITSVGTVDGFNRTIVGKINSLQISAIQAALNGNYDLSINGTITADGRDHDMNGNVIGPGTYGVSTSGQFNLGGSANVGGNGIAPNHPAPAGTYQEYAPPLPPTPEEILGLPPGALDAYRTTVPPTLPMQGGIVYMDSNDGSATWNGPDFGDAENPSWGILIFHNTNGDAELRNVHGHFRGIIITDRLVHINGDCVIRGAVLVMDANSNVGNGSAQVEYSTIAINNSTTSLSRLSSWDDTSIETIQYN